MIKINQLTKHYPGFTLDNISLTLPKGSILGLVGENGAGKSTLIKCIMNAINKDSGTVEVLGINNEDKAFVDIKQDIGVVLDEAYFPEVLTAKRMGNVMQHTYRNWDNYRYNAYLKQFSLPDDKEFKDFSRGMKMKLAIAIALSHQPHLLILDEATGGLDPLARDEVLDVLNAFRSDGTRSILLSSHIVSDLEKICDYIAFIHQGQLICCERIDLLLERYTSELGEKTTLEDIILYLAKSHNKEGDIQ